MKRFNLLWSLIVCFSSVFCSCTKSVEITSFDWPQWRGPDGNGQSRETEWDPASITKPRILWKYDVGYGHPNVAIQDGRLYTVGMKGYDAIVFCLDAATGKRVWETSLGPAGEPQATPAVDGDSLFVLSAKGVLYCLDTGSGKQQWRKDIVAECGALIPFYKFAGSPVVEGDLVLLTANTAGMALDRRTGQLAWSSEKPPRETTHGDWNGADYSTPVLHVDDGRETVLFFSWRGLSSVDTRSGRTIWQYSWNSSFNVQCADPVVVGDRILLSSVWNPGYSRKSILLETTLKNPRVVWSSPDLACDITTPVAIDGCIYGCNGALHWGVDPKFASLRCVELGTGRLLWEEMLVEPGKTLTQISLTAAGDILIVLDVQGTLYTAKASPEGFKEIARCDVLKGASGPRKFWTPPVLCNAKIYCRNYAGDLVCIDVSRQHPN